MNWALSQLINDRVVERAGTLTKITLLPRVLGHLS